MTPCPISIIQPEIIQAQFQYQPIVSECRPVVKQLEIGKQQNITINVTSDIKYELLTIATAGQTSFVLALAPLSPTTSSLFLNGLKQIYNDDYSIAGNVLTWLDSIIIDPATDELDIYYI